MTSPSTHIGQDETCFGGAVVAAVAATFGSSNASAEDGVVPRVAGSMVASWSPAVVSTGQFVTNRCDDVLIHGVWSGF